TADFADFEGNLKAEALERLDTFLALCRELGLYALPTFFVGHMSGMNFPIPWEKGRDFYADPEVLARSRRFVSGIVSRYRDEGTILGWILSNEITHHAGKRETHVLVHWMRELYRAIRRIDPRRPIGPGDGADDLKGNGLGYPEGAMGGIEDLGDAMDFVSLHHYYLDPDPFATSHAPAATVRLCDIGLPVLVEEFGMSTGLWSEEAQADYTRIVLFSTWAAGAAGALVWCWSDFPTLDLSPYTHHPFELFFGITRDDGSEKPAAKELRRFASLTAELGATRWSPVPPQATILVPSTFYVNYPFRSVDRRRLLKALLGAYILSRMAGFDVAFVREPGVPPEGVRLLLVPYGDLLASSWRDLKAWVEAGGVLWAGFGGAVPNLRDLFGVRPDRRLRPPVPPQGIEGKLRLVEAFGDLEAGEEIFVPASDAPYLPVSPTKARVLAVDEDGNPALTVHPVGQGKAFFCPRSLEWLLTHGSEPHRRSPVHRLYRALRAEAGVRVPFEARHPALSLNLLENEEGGKLLVAINHSDAPLEEEVHSQRTPRRVVDIESGKELALKGQGFHLSLEPWGVKVLWV
ncbi:cellulase family glycosylhydrolase, partial [Candidatus Bipolaricaulota bacterium]|nr:cellulase family glycosylhydrolase [Candidatus Bipolaricaulota bacterium]